MYLVTIAAQNKESFIKACNIIARQINKHTSMTKSKWHSDNNYIYHLNKSFLDDPDLLEVLESQTKNISESK